MANLIEKQQVTKTAEGLLVTGGFETWQSECGYSLIIDYVLIRMSGVKIGFSGTGRQILAAGLENEAECECFNTEIAYSFDELGMSEDFFEAYGEDAINELVFLTEKSVKDEY